MRCERARERWRATGNAPVSSLRPPQMLPAVVAQD